MENGRIRIADIAEELGLSTATVSNVIHGKTKKISDEKVKRVQELLEKRQYIANMAGILLAQNDSKIVGVVINDHEKYEGHTLEDQFISASVNALAKEMEKADKFLMLKVTGKWRNNKMEKRKLVIPNDIKTAFKEAGVKKGRRLWYIHR